MTKRFQANTTLSIRPPVPPVQFLWTLINAPIDVLISGTTNASEVQINFPSYASLTGVILRCRIADSSGCVIVSDKKLNVLIAEPLTFNIACNAVLSITDFLGDDVAILSGTHTGTMTVLPTGQINYTSFGGLYSDVFQYKLRAEQGAIESNVSTITVNVAQCVTPCDSVLLIQNLAFDSANDTITFNVVSSGTFLPSELTVTSNIGTVQYTNGNGIIQVTQNGTYIITANIKNLTCDVFDVKSINVSMVQAPQIVDNSFTMSKKGQIVFNPLLNDSDPSGGTLSILTINGNAFTTGVSIIITEGAITVNSDGSISFSPNSTYVGSLSFTYTAQSSVSLKSATATIYIDVLCIAPTIELISFETPNSLTANPAAYNLKVLNANNQLISAILNGNTSVAYTITDAANHVLRIEIPIAQLDPGVNTFQAIATTDCGTVTYNHSFNNA